MKVHRAKAKVRGLFVVVPYSSQFTSPNINAIASFLNVIVVNLRSMLEMEVDLIPCSKHLWKSLCDELESFGPFLKTIMELLQADGDKEIKDLWRETMNMIYNVDYFTKLYFVRRFSWYGIISLPCVIENIKSIKIKINEIDRVDKIHKMKKIGDHEQAKGTESFSPRGMEGNKNDSMGFRKVEETIINDLITRGRMSLTLISISGSGGQGKTTLARKIYNEPNVRWRFQKVVWLYVCKEFNIKDLLIQILYEDDKGGGANDSEIEDLMLGVWRSLKRKRYLIVLDDIWDIDGWGRLESLFPDDNNGSRILLTSRNQELASQIELSSISHPLQLFDDEESWELMKKRIFDSENCDKEFLGIGRKIASYCKGLPLAVALIAGVLRRTERNLNTWNKVAENLKNHLAEEGCGDVLDLSYMYLPDHLKSCFLYFAAFKRGKEVRANRLKLLWTGEGFANQVGGTNPLEEDSATKYLKDLISLGLVVMTKWRGENFCTVHDLLYDMCLEKARENNFMHWTGWNSYDEWNIHSNNGLLKYNHHRLRICECDPFIRSNLIVTRRELPTSSLHSFLFSSYASRGLSLCFLNSFKILTVLKLKLQINDFPEEILSSICLRYLSLHIEGLQCVGKIRAIPPTITNLRKLRTFIIMSDGMMLPFDMWNMMSLRYVYIRFGHVILEDFDMENSIKSNIQSLGGLMVLYEDDRMMSDFLRKFPNLRRLKVFIRGSRWQMHIFESLSTQLESLRLWFDRNSLPIVWNFPKIPNLTKLKLDGTNIPWSVLSEIGKQLPNLHVLKLYTESCEGRIWKLVDGAFPNLIYLMLAKLSIEEFDISSCDDPFPCLEHLYLDSCTELMEISPVFEEMYTLKTMEFNGCPNKLEASAMRILKEQRELGNDSLQVIIHRD